jgi:hypothetical protein
VARDGLGRDRRQRRAQSLFIDEQADRITFNRYTGVPGIATK